ncbi:hypothetical protein GCM10009785_08670 [Brooklawnia cerclae]|uniref:DUF4440 domain-containing protein n=1 Tax=Brooklawnia cerclae TaxID=349934 RepID=A0ABX0SJ62_9ACTN|nr:nuclear transport factor 2 family protein [Brooklawnia cerclae]NIH58444.1 hypothetical protein [Brooklawnia cerclae]
MNQTTTALAELLEINQRLGDAESAADKGFFRSLLHERFTMRRPGGALSSRDEFVAGLTVGAHRRTTMLALELHGSHRATARCRVDKWTLAEPEAVQSFDNLRVFIHEGGRWQLLTWLAEPC